MTAEKAADEGSFGDLVLGFGGIGCGLLILLVILFSIGGCIVAAFEGDFDDCPKKANGSLDCSYQDLSGADLSGANLSGADFSGADFSGANLRKTNFSGANFSGANLNGVDFYEADLRNAHLSGLDLSGGEMLRGADLSGADLSGANLTSADLRNVNFSGANLKGADLRGADFAGGWRPDAKLTGANLEGATADTNTDWPGDFDWKAAGVTVTTTTTIQPLPKGFKVPPGDVIDRTVTLIDMGQHEVRIKARNSGTKSAYYCIRIEYRLPDGWEYESDRNRQLDQEGFFDTLRFTYGTDYSIPPDGQERVLVLERRPDWYGMMFYKYYTGPAITYRIDKFEKLSSPC
jgi:hypothetical protein